MRVIKFDDSIELCGGTHVMNTGNIGMIKIVSESSIAAGIRRIEAITGEAVEDSIDNTVDTLRQISGMLNNAPDVVAAIRRAIEENADLRREAEEYMNERVKAMTAEVISKAEEVKGFKLVTLTGIRVPDIVKNIAFSVRRDSPENTAFVAATVDMTGKPLLTVMFTEDLVKSGLNASTIVRTAAKEIKGGGGGQPGFAQAGGKDKDGLSRAFEAIREAIAE